MNKYWNKENIPRSATKVVVAICADKKRRDCILKSGNVSVDTINSLTRLNTAISSAFECIEVGVRDILFSDICTGTGYRFSDARTLVCQYGYYARKRTVIRNIAQQLNLI